jgi:hypothetical protein
MILICLLWSIYGIAAPQNLVQTSTDTNTTSMTASGPDSHDTRTVLSLVWSCLAIIFSCTWTAIHPNIPDPKDGGCKIFFRKVGMCLMVIIVPEWMVMVATRQLIHAFALKNKLKGSGSTGKLNDIYMNHVPTINFDHEQTNGHLHTDSSWEWGDLYYRMKDMKCFRLFLAPI